MIKAMSMLAVAALAGAAATALAPAASATTAPSSYPYHLGEFVDKPYEYYDSCAFDYKPGKYVKFVTKQIVEYVYGYPVYYTLVKATCKVDQYYKSKKKITYYNFKCTLSDQNDYYDIKESETYDSKFQIKKGSNYGTLTCKFKNENDPVEEAPTDAAPAE